MFLVRFFWNFWFTFLAWLSADLVLGEFHELKPKVEDSFFTPMVESWSRGSNICSEELSAERRGVERIGLQNGILEDW